MEGPHALPLHSGMCSPKLRVGSSTAAIVRLDCDCLPRGILGSVVQELRVVVGPSAPGGRGSSHLSLDDGVSGPLFTIHSNSPEMRLGPASPDLSFGEKAKQQLEAEV